MYLVHDSFKDVFCEIVTGGHKYPNYRKYLIRWWNLGFSGNPWKIVPTLQMLKIKDSEVLRWKSFDPNQPQTHPGRQS